MIPIIDTFLPLDNSNYSGKKAIDMEKDARFMFPLYILALLESIFFFYILIMIRKEEIVSFNDPLTFILKCYLLGMS